MAASAEQPIVTDESTTHRIASSGQRALSILVVHLFLVSAFGRDYAKIKVALFGIELYPTELAIGAAALLGIGAIVSVAWDGTTKLVTAFVLLGCSWVALAGSGGMAGAGAKAFSFFLYAILYFIIRGAATTSEARWRVLHSLAAASVVGALFGFWQTQFGEGFPTSTGSVRWLGGEFALYSLLGALVVLVRAILVRKLGTASTIVLVAAVAELILAQHRSGFVACAVSLAATAALLGGSAEALQRLLKLLIVTVVSLGAFMWLFGGSYLDATVSRISETTDLSDGTIAWRLLSWYEVASGISEQPWGHGFAHWEFLFTIVGTGQGSDPLLGSHNSLLDLTYRIGIPGLVLFLAMPTTLIILTRRAVAKTGPGNNVLAVTTCAALIALLVFASFNVVLESPYLSIFFWVLLAIGAGELSNEKERRHKASV